jgi:predicted acylesterase/phospholipase RssA
MWSKGIERMGAAPVVRILVGVAGRSLSVMVGMVAGARDAFDERFRDTETGWQPLALGVSGGAIGAVAAATGMRREQLRQLAVEHPESMVMGKRNFGPMLRNRVLYPHARVHDLARAIAGDRTFADFRLSDPTDPTASSLLIPVYSARFGNLLLPRDLPKLGRTDMPLVEALVAATRIPGMLPAAAGLDDVYDGGCEYRVPHEVFAPHPSVILDLYGPEPHDSRGGLLFPLLGSGLPAVRHRPRPFRDPRLRESTIFAGMPYGSALGAPSADAGELFDRGYEIAVRWLRARSPEQIRSLTAAVPTS